MLTEEQEKTCQAIINIFETGSANGDYGQVTVLHDRLREVDEEGCNVVVE